MRLIVGVALAVFGAGSAVGFGTAGLVTAHPPPAPVGVVSFMAALRRHDGAQIWSSYSPAFRERRIEAGDSEDATVALFEEQRQKGASIDDQEYVGGYQTKEGGHFLYVTRHVRPNEEPTEVVWVLRTDADGLIEECLRLAQRAPTGSNWQNWHFVVVTDPTSAPPSPRSTGAASRSTGRSPSPP